MYKIIYLFLIIFINVSCSQNKSSEVVIMDETVKQNLEIVGNSKIYFGHQSVGKNIMDGLSELNKEAKEENINIIEFDGIDKLTEYYFAHSRIGENRNPNSKCDAFSQLLNNKFAEELDIAMLKFCYVDFGAETNPKTVFEYYKFTIDTIKIKYPDLTIVHVTIPLKTVQTGWKIPFKKLLGKEIPGYVENIKRFQFNKMLKDYYKNDTIFDLSKIESTYPNGSRESFTMDGETYYALVPEYTNDGGHLNELGRQLAAKELISVIANIISEKSR